MLGGIQPQNKRFAWKTCGKPLAPLDYLPMRWYPLGGIPQQKKKRDQTQRHQSCGAGTTPVLTLSAKNVRDPRLRMRWRTRSLTTLCVAFIQKRLGKATKCTLYRGASCAECWLPRMIKENQKMATTNKKHAYHHRFKLIKAFRAAFSPQADLNAQIWQNRPIQSDQLGPCSSPKLLRNPEAGAKLRFKSLASA